MGSGRCKNKGFVCLVRRKKEGEGRRYCVARRKGVPKEERKTQKKKKIKGVVLALKERYRGGLHGGRREHGGGRKTTGEGEGGAGPGRRKEQRGGGKRLKKRNWVFG